MLYKSISHSILLYTRISSPPPLVSDAFQSTYPGRPKSSKSQTWRLKPARPVRAQLVKTCWTRTLNPTWYQLVHCNAASSKHKPVCWPWAKANLRKTYFRQFHDHCNQMTLMQAFAASPKLLMAATYAKALDVTGFVRKSSGKQWAK